MYRQRQRQVGFYMFQSESNRLVKRLYEAGYRYPFGAEFLKENSKKFRMIPLSY